jgi:hypothetical protein
MRRRLARFRIADAVSWVRGESFGLRFAERWKSLKSHGFTR